MNPNTSSNFPYLWNTIIILKSLVLKNKPESLKENQIEPNTKTPTIENKIIIPYIFGLTTNPRTNP